MLPYPYQSPPFYGTWDQKGITGMGRGRGKKKNHGQGLLTGALGIPQDTGFNKNVWSKIPLFGQLI